MINSDEIDPAKPAAKLRDLQVMSIEELNVYIDALEKEILRADTMIAKKQAHKSGIDALFGASRDDG